VSLKDIRIAVIGTGASGVQTIQECAPVAKHLVVYQRTPNNALPMVQLSVNLDGVKRDKAQGIDYKANFEACFKSYTGFGLGFNGKNAFDDTPEERNKVYEDLLKMGGFNLLLSGYQDLGINERANHEVSRALQNRRFIDVFVNSFIDWMVRSLGLPFLAKIHTLSSHGSQEGRNACTFRTSPPIRSQEAFLGAKLL
jgi:hypothetical protein